MPENQRHYNKWTKEELRRAEATASRFLEDNSTQIADTLRAKARFLDYLIHRISLRDTTFEERLEYLARITEIARLIEEDADGFFELASQPVVARLLGTVPRKKASGG